MTKHDFIFSDKRSHRIARHVAFWFLWCFSFNLLFHYPIHVFKGWDISGPGTKNFQELGPLLFFIKSFWVNSFFGVIVPQIAFTYVLIYWLIPRCYFKKRKLILTVAVSAVMLLIFYLIAIVFKYSPGVYNYFAFSSPLNFEFDLMRRIVLVDQATTLPIIAGIALMIKLIKRWWQKFKETEQLAREKIKAELQLLKAQVHPHFLFNTLNNIYFFTLSGSAKAPDMIKKLSGLLHYILNECNQSLVPLEKEILMIRDYMELEKIRYGEHMNMTIELPDSCNNKMIAPLLLIPFVENSFKHGTSKMLTESFLKLSMKIDDDQLLFLIGNSKPAVNSNAPNKQGNIGLKNVKKRLALLYPGDHELIIRTEPEAHTVELKIQLKNAATFANNEEENILTPAYALA